MISFEEFTKFIGYAATVLTYIGVLCSAIYNNEFLGLSQIKINFFINGVAFVAVYTSLVGVKFSNLGVEECINILGIVMYGLYFAFSSRPLKEWKNMLINVFLHVLMLTSAIYITVAREPMIAFSNIGSIVLPIVSFLLAPRWKLSKFELVLSICNIITTVTDDKTYSLKFLHNLKVPQTVLSVVYMVICVVDVLDLKFNVGFGVSLKTLVATGNENYNMRNYSDALHNFNKAVLADPKNASLRLNCVDTLIELGKFKEAFEGCKAITRRDPLNGGAHSKMTTISLRFGRLDLAREYAIFVNPEPLKVLRAEITNVEHHFENFEIARKMNDWEYATQKVEDCIAMGIQSTFVWTFKAEILLNKLKLDEAEKTLDKGTLKEAPIFPMDQSLYFGMFLDLYILIIKGRVDMAFGRFETALEFYTRAAALDPTCTELCAVRDRFDSTRQSHRKGNMFLHKGMLKEAAASFADGLQYDPCNVLLCDATSYCYEKMGQWEKCAIFCDRALQISPSYTRARNRRACCSAKMGNFPQSGLRRCYEGGEGKQTVGTWNVK